MNLLFVCSGNTCRSPLAVAAWEAFSPQVLAPLAASRRALPVMTIASAGLSAVDGEPATRHAIEVADSWGVDLSTHRARRFVAEMANEADLICAMTTDQAATIRLRFAVTPESVRLLGEFKAKTDDALLNERLAGLSGGDFLTCSSEESLSILDPYGGSAEAYQACGAQIRAAVMGLAKAIGEGYMEGREVWAND